METTILSPVIALFVALVGFPAFLTSALSVAKSFNLVTDGNSGTVVFWANLLALVGVGVAVGTGNAPLVASIDNQLGVIGTFLLAFGTFATEIGLTRVFYQGLRGIPFVGYSHTLKKT